MNPRIFIIMIPLLLNACSVADYDPHVSATANQVATRSYQTRQFEAVEYQALMHAVISTLQDYHFRIRELDAGLGVLTAYQVTAYDSQAHIGGRTELTVFVRQQEQGRITVRVNMSTGPQVENQPELYQQFFAAVSKTLHQQGKV
ncbi:hypothetical protein EYC98_08200 [Halieaceae bacterium IMCC14734]|jgi:hypothetical protein|uniref:DUF3568 family protein n=1 Tax=Candidatus Litorirhabdus singularis TaxID=2518993 RepID=A0ABT3TFQ4_9GAMM|nr:hypothetical protein [Candidatus Litorirhabdus singularis]MCX2980854.1 hypothetical protein [Candidatus Litorirhabdus singularis]